MGELRKKLGVVDLTFFGIGAIVGTGIFIIPAIAAKVANVGSFWIWLELGLLTIFMALCFAELSSIYPNAGGPYTFVKEAFGNYFGFLSGWMGWLISWLTIASLAAAVPFYMSFFFELTQPYMVALSLVVLAIVTLWNYHGLHWGVKAQYLFTSASILVLWFFITWGFSFVKISNFALTTTVGLPALLLAAVFVIEPFIGWETITYFSEDAKNPKIDIPRAIIYSSIFVSLIYSAVIFVTLGVLNAETLGQTVFPLAAAAGVFIGPVGAAIVAFGAILVLLGCLNSWIVSTARLPFAIARDGLFPKLLAKLHPKHHTPHISLLFQFVFSAVAVAIAPFETIIYILVVLAMLMYMMVFFTIPVFRKRKSKIAYKLPLGPTIPIIASTIALGVLTQVALEIFSIVAGMLGVGSIIYLYIIKGGK